MPSDKAPAKEKRVTFATLFIGKHHITIAASDGSRSRMPRSLTTYVKAIARKNRMPIEKFFELALLRRLSEHESGGRVSCARA